MPTELRRKTARGLALALGLSTTGCSAPMPNPSRGSALANKAAEPVWTCQVALDGANLAEGRGLGLIALANGCIRTRAAEVTAGRLVVESLPQWEKAWLLLGGETLSWGELRKRSNARGDSELEVDLMQAPLRALLEPWPELHIAQLLRAAKSDSMWDSVCEAALAEALRRESRALASVAAEVLEAGRHDLSASYAVSRLGSYDEVILASLDVKRVARDKLELTLKIANKGKSKTRRVGGLVAWGPRISVIDERGRVVWSNHTESPWNEVGGRLLLHNRAVEPNEEVSVWRDVIPEKLPKGCYTIRWWVNDLYCVSTQQPEGRCVMVTGKSDFVVD